MNTTVVPRHRRTRRRLLLALIFTAVVVGIVGTSLMLVIDKASTVREEMQSATQLLPRLKSEVVRGDAKDAAKTVEELKLHTSSAREATSGPLWTLAGSLPLLGSNLTAVRELATSADDVARLGAVPLVSVMQSLDWKSLMPNGSAIDVGPLANAEPQISSAAHAVRESSDRLNSIDPGVLLPQVSAPLIEAREQLATLRIGLDAAANAARIAPAMMGAEKPRKYLLLVQNNAESRATGGIPGALAVLTLNSGKLTLESQTSAGDMGTFAPPVTVDPEQQLIYSPRLGKFMQDVNLTPDFPTAASAAKEMWKRKTGRIVDGVISVDPVALSYILDATGPVKMSSPDPINLADSGLPTELSGKNVVSTLLSDVYAKIGEPKLQDAYFAGAAQEIFHAISSGKGNAKGLVEGITRGAEEGRVLVWSGEANEQAIIAQYPLSGSIAGPSISPAQFGVYFNDGTGAKMDYHVTRTVQLIQECPADGYSQVKVRVTSTNTAPKDAATSLPEYVTGGGAFGVPAGTVQTNVIAYGPVQSNVETAFVAGKKIGFASHMHSGRPVGSVTVRLAPGESSAVEFTFGKIVQHTAPQLSVTPTVQALKDVVLDTISAKCVPAP